MAAQGGRKFHGDFPKQQEKPATTEEAILTFINGNIIGKDLTFEGPFGTRKGIIVMLILIAR